MVLAGSLMATGIEQDALGAKHAKTGQKQPASATLIPHTAIASMYTENATATGKRLNKKPPPILTCRSETLSILYVIWGLRGVPHAKK